MGFLLFFFVLQWSVLSGYPGAVGEWFCEDPWGWGRDAFIWLVCSFNPLVKSFFKMIFLLLILIIFNSLQMRMKWNLLDLCPGIQIILPGIWISPGCSLEKTKPWRGDYLYVLYGWFHESRIWVELLDLYFDIYLNESLPRLYIVAFGYFCLFMMLTKLRTNIFKGRTGSIEQLFLDDDGTF